ncbi:alpha/beta fold hydrolase [Nocardioides sp.]|uniref:alpha/beta fold hydrolase n=1 Tax=Nocardioides sp. TaxID=35761 RepID=UPI0035AF6C53
MKAAVVLVLLGLLAAAGCTGGETNGDSAPRRAPFEEVGCPSDVDASVLAPITCGYVTVPEDRTDPGRTIRLFVLRVEPPERLHEEPVFIAGTNLGNAPNYGGIAPVAQRLGREAILLDPRGVGHSEPSLACPEVEVRRRAVLAAATSDEDVRASFLSAVAACRQRLEGERIDLDAYTVEAMAADAEDLRRALGIERWNVHSYGTAARITLEMLRSSDSGVRAAFMDSPEPEQVDPRREGALALRTSLEHVAALCRDDIRCRRQYGDPSVTLERALRKLAGAPERIEVLDPATGEEVSVLVDDVMLLRLLRAVISDGGSSGSLFLPESVPALVSLAARGRLAELGSLLKPLAGEDTAYCTGYVPKCADQMALSEGVYYSVMCRDAGIPDDAKGVQSDAVAAEPAYAEMFGDNPFGDVCSRWGEVERTGAARPLVESDVPALVLVGGFATYNRLSTIRAGIDGLSEATVVVNPRQGHNVLVGACMGEIRLRWHQDFELTGRDLSCIDDRMPWKSERDLLRAAAAAGG